MFKENHPPKFFFKATSINGKPTDAAASRRDLDDVGVDGHGKRGNKSISKRLCKNSWIGKN